MSTIHRGQLVRATPGAAAPRAAAAFVRRATGRLTEPRFALVVAAVYLVTLLPRIWVHVMWRDEWQAWMLAVPTPPLGELFGRLRYEGHPSLWHLLIWAAAHVWPQPIVMKLLSAAVATAVVYVVAAHAPFSRGVRVLICGGYFLLFEYAVVSRGYGLGVLALMAFAALHVRRPRAWVWQGLALAVAANANLFATLLAAAAAGVMLARWLGEGRQASARFAAGLGLFGVGLALASWQMWPPPDRHYATFVFGLDAERGGRVLAGFWRSFFPLPYPGRFWWGNNVLDATLRPEGRLIGLQPLLGLLTLGLVTWLLPRRRAATLLWVGGAAIMAGFLYVVFPGGLRHQGYWPMLALLSLWVGGGFATLRPLKRRLWVGLMAVGAVGGVVASAADVFMPFSASRAVGEYVAAHYPADAAVIGGFDSCVSPVAGVLGRPIFYVSVGRPGRFVRWDDDRHDALDPALLRADARRLAAQARAEGRLPVVLLVLSRPDRHPLPPAEGVDPGRAFVPVAAFDDATVEDERYRLFEFRPEAHSRP